MYCSNCGTQSDGNAQVCSQCGKPFAAAADPVPATVNFDVMKLLQPLTKADISQERFNAIVRQVLGLIALMIAVFAIARKPNPGIFILYAIPPLLGGIVVVLEHRASVGRAIFVLAMLVPYFSLFLVGVPPILVSGVQNMDKVAAGLGGFVGSVGASTAFLVAGFLFMIFSSMSSLVFSKSALFSGIVSVGLTLLFAILFMAMLGSPAAAVKQSLTIGEQLDKNVKIHTTALAPSEKGDLTETKSFKSNEIIYPYLEGMTVGAHYGFRVLDDAGMVVKAFSRSDTERAKGVGLEKGEALNNADQRLKPGAYTLELMVTQGWKTMVVARTKVSVSAEINPNYGSQSGDDYAWLAGADNKPATAFAAGNPVHLVLDGSRLQGGVSIMVRNGADKIILDKDYDAMPLGQSDYVLADKASALGSGSFMAVITSEGKQALTIYFTIK